MITVRCLLVALVLVGSGATAPAEPIKVDATTIELSPGQPEVRRVGRLAWRGGLHLTSSDKRFGGYSGLEQLPDGRLVAVSDVGHWLVFRPVFTMEGQLVGVFDTQIEPLKDASGQALKRKALADAESVRRDRDGTLLVSFERRHRLHSYFGPGASARTVAPPDDLESQPDNGGIEALATWPDGRILLISEQARAEDYGLKAWLRHRGAWHELSYAISGEHQPTDAVALASGDLLVLERRYGLFVTQGARVVHVPGHRIFPGGQMYGEVLADWQKPMSVDNMEAMAVAYGPTGGPDAGATLLWLMSDDNVSKLQRTLLMLFRLD